MRVCRSGPHLHARASKETAAPHEVSAKEINDNRLDVGDVDFVDEAVDLLAQRLPRQPCVVVRKQRTHTHVCNKGKDMENKK